jgi:membrane protein
MIRPADSGARVRAMDTVIDVFRRSVHRFFLLEGFDRAMALAGQAFAALLPLLIVMGAVSPTSGEDAASAIIDRLELTGNAATAVNDAVAQPAAIQDGITGVSSAILVISALAFTRALQRLYTRAWALEKMGVRGNLSGLTWLLAFSLFWSLQPAIIGVFDGAAATAVTLLLSCVLWLFTPWVLVARQIPWRRLLPQSLLTALGLSCLGVASALYMPRAIASAAAQFGFIGVAFSLLSFLFLAALVLVVTAAVGAVLGEPSPVGESPRSDDARPRAAT